MRSVHVLYDCTAQVFPAEMILDSKKNFLGVVTKDFFHAASFFSHKNFFFLLQQQKKCSKTLAVPLCRHFIKKTISWYISVMYSRGHTGTWLTVIFYSSELRLATHLKSTGTREHLSKYVSGANIYWKKNPLSAMYALNCIFNQCVY